LDANTGVAGLKIIIFLFFQTEKPPNLLSEVYDFGWLCLCLRLPCATQTWRTNVAGRKLQFAALRLQF
jgi:hypothetical protein